MHSLVAMQTQALFPLQQRMVKMFLFRVVSAPNPMALGKIRFLVRIKNQGAPCVSPTFAPLTVDLH
jgi:hypothetical protein